MSIIKKQPRPSVFEPTSTLHQSIVREWRHAAKDAGISTKGYSDSELFDVVEWWSDETSASRHEIMVFADLQVGVKRSN